MIRQSIALTLASLITSTAFADAIAIKPRVIYSQATPDAEGTTRTETTTGIGFGVDADFKLDDRAKVGAELSSTNYEKDDAKANDVALGGFLAYDFISQSNLSVFGKAGLSLHQFALEDFQSASLLNADFGVGTALAFAPNLDVGAEYKYSTTLSKGDMKDDDNRGITLKDVSLQRSDVSVFVAFKF